MTMSLIFSVAMPICTFFAFIFFLMRYQIEKYNFLFVYHQEYESVYLNDNITNLQIVTVLFFQLVNFTQIQSLMQSDLYIVHYSLLVLQVIIFVAGSVYKNRYPERFENILHKYFFLPAKAVHFREASERLPEDMIKALCEAYQHPWHKLEGNIKFYNERENWTKNMKKDTV